jgi:uncharacterized protein (DUF3084 family)
MKTDKRNSSEKIIADLRLDVRCLTVELGAANAEKASLKTELERVKTDLDEFREACALVEDEPPLMRLPQVILKMKATIEKVKTLLAEEQAKAS